MKTQKIADEKGKKVKFQCDAKYGIGADRWVSATIIGENPTNTAYMIVEDEKGEKWSVHNCALLAR